VEGFQAALALTNVDELETVLLRSAANSNDWLARKKKDTASLAATSIAGYIIGLGGRHTWNILSSPETGKLVHIDFGDVFEKAQDRPSWAEEVPLWLTRALIRPLDVLGVDGEFRRLSVIFVKELHARADQFAQLLSVFIDDPLLNKIDWKEKVAVVERKLNGIDRRLFNRRYCSGMEAVVQIDEIIAAATNTDSLTKMLPG
jgi:FKBP12-rapamycin complex-associated protein